MKIVVATPLYPPEISASAVYIKELAKRLGEHHEVHVVAYANHINPEKSITLTTVDKSLPLPVRLYKYTRTLFAATQDTDIIFAHEGVAAAFPAVIVGRLRKIPVVFNYVGDESWRRAIQLRLTDQSPEVFTVSSEGSRHTGAVARIERLVFRWARTVIAPSLYGRNSVEKQYGVSQDHTEVLYPPFERLLSLPFNASVIPRHIVVRSRLSSWKRIDGIIRAVARLKKTFPEISLSVIGDGKELETLKTLTRELRTEENVSFLGRLSQAETQYIIQSAEIYVSNAEHEESLEVLYSAFALGIPVVATDAPLYNEIITNDTSGILISPDRETALSDAIARLFTDPQLRKNLASSGSETLRHRSWEEHTESMLRILNKTA